MTRISAVVLAALLVLSVPAASIEGGAANAPAADTATDADGLSSTALVTTSEGVSWMSIDADGSRSEYADARADIGSALGDADAELRAEFSTNGVENRHDDATTAAERRAVINRSVADVEAEIAELHERERSAAARFARGELTKHQFLKEISRIHAEAASLRSTVETINRLADDDQAQGIRLSGQLNRFQTPLRSDIADALKADSGAVEEIMITTDGNRLVMARVDGSNYLREAVQYDNYVHNGPINFESLLDVSDGMDVSERAAEIYPWIYSNSRNDNSHRWYNNLMWAQIEHDRGTLQTYLDSTTRNVVLEHHRLDLRDLRTTPTVSKSGQNADVEANRVPGGGPVWVNVSAPDGEPIDANVTVGDYATRVGEDGAAWIPADEGNVRITATVDAGTGETENVSVTVREPSD